MLYYRVEYHTDYSMYRDNYEDFVDRDDLNSSYIPEICVVNSNEMPEVFELCTGINNEHLVQWDIEPTYVIDEEGDTLELDDYEGCRNNSICDSNETIMFYRIIWNSYIHNEEEDKCLYVPLCNVPQNKGLIEGLNYLFETLTDYPNTFIKSIDINKFYVFDVNNHIFKEG